MWVLHDLLVYFHGTLCFPLEIVPEHGVYYYRLKTHPPVHFN